MLNALKQLLKRDPGFVVLVGCACLIVMTLANARFGRQHFETIGTNMPLLAEPTKWLAFACETATFRAARSVVFLAAVCGFIFGIWRSAEGPCESAGTP